MKKKTKQNMVLLPLILLLTIVPLVVHIHVYSTNLAQFNWYPASDSTSDFFLYYKALLITWISVAMCVVLAWRYMTKKGEFKWSYQLAPLGIFAVMILLSTLFSRYKYFCFHGSTEMFETFWVVMGYCVMAFYAYQLVRTMDSLDCVMKWLTVGLGAMLTLGVFQAAGMDLFATKIGKMMITDSSQWDSLDSISIIFEKGRVFLTLYNPNYVASYFALMIPVEIALLVRSEKLVFRGLYAVMIVASVVCLMASGNRSGIVAFAVSAVLAIVVLHRQILKQWKLVLVGVVVIGFVLGAFISKNTLILDKFARLFSQDTAAVEDDGISKIITGDEDVAVTYHGETLHLAYGQLEDGSIGVYMADDAGVDVAYDLDGENAIYTITDGRFDGFTIQLVQLGDVGVALDLHADGLEWYFVRGSDDTYYYYNVYGRLDKVNNAPRVAVKWLEQRFEERGTIWSKTIPLLPASLFVGTGPDTYAVVYPQDDYVDKAYDGSNGTIDVKPHCYYFQIAVQYGMVALLAFLVLYGWYFVNGLRLYMGADYKDPMEIVGAGLYFSLFTYIVISVLNDSTVNVSPIFWIMLGLGLGVNEMLGKKAIGVRNEE